MGRPWRLAQGASLDKESTQEVHRPKEQVTRSRRNDATLFDAVRDHTPTTRIERTGISTRR